MLTLSQVIILLVFIALGSAGIAAMQDGISMVFKHFTRDVEFKKPEPTRVFSRSSNTGRPLHY
ncbi:hypothetical protein KFE96_10420 [Kordiimonas sp. SCSIO 12603]|uniref:hypothetical protein n=1 Tax=Kordiimonas sp. SCSIO 12603 TaxID=2829596 RepID=UPI002104E67A|nr:hypothetical protein [Kordiimonas sp. SCSIO 12603]UTW57271.1 hypothetical protein KFE96_10420 [Kordiimonas sp. SCSIO 12603]